MQFALIKGKKFSILYNFQQLDGNKHIKFLGCEIFNIFLRSLLTFGKLHVKTGYV